MGPIRLRLSENGSHFLALYRNPDEDRQFSPTRFVIFQMDSAKNYPLVPLCKEDLTIKPRLVSNL